MPGEHGNARPEPDGVPGRLAVFGAAHALVVSGRPVITFVGADPYAQWPRACSTLVIAPAQNIEGPLL